MFIEPCKGGMYVARFGVRIPPFQGFLLFASAYPGRRQARCAHLPLPWAIGFRPFRLSDRAGAVLASSFLKDRDEFLLRFSRRWA